MNNWKAMFDLGGKTVEIIVKAEAFPSAHINAQAKHPEGRIISTQLNAKLKK